MTFMEKLKEEHQKSKRIHQDTGSGQLPTTRGGAGNLSVTDGSEGADKYPGVQGTTTEASKESGGQSGTVKQSTK